MANWIVAESLNRLRQQVNALAPNRSKASDGTIADAAHPKTSDHVPRLIAGANLVSALDLTHDPAGGLDCAKLCAALVAAKDSRIKYVIYARRIISGAGGPQPWVARPYSGANAHLSHLHLSVVADGRCRDGSPWMLPGMGGSKYPTLMRGSTGKAVELIQRFLGVVGPGDVGYSYYGPLTESAVKRYQEMRGLVPDGVCGPLTWRETGL